MNEKLIQDRIDQIKDENLKTLVTECFNRIPKYWFMKPSSSTGKYHPKEEHLPGGLSLHTARVFDIGVKLADARKFDCNLEIIKAGCLLHDIARFGVEEKPSEHSLKDHANRGADWVHKIGEELNIFEDDTPLGSDTDLDRVCKAIRSHMGRWNFPEPETSDEILVHLADVVAASYVPVTGEKLV